jgi:hypothetical protein
LRCPVNRSYLNLLMLKSDSSKSWNLKSRFSRPILSKSNLSKPNLKTRSRQPALTILWVTTAFLILLSSASAQDFTLQAAPFSPDAVAPGGTSSSNITVGTVNGFSGTVDLTCQVSSTQTTTSPPICAVSPKTVTPPANAAVTITTTAQTTTVGYTITITGTATAAPADTHTTPPQNLTVLAVTAQFTITVQSAVVPNSVPAGSGSQGAILINPINGYSSPTTQIGGHTVGGITLSCVSITPLVTNPPVCSFNPPNPAVNGVPITSTLTISTYGPITTTAGAVAHRRPFLALWLSLPMLALVGLGAAMGGRQSRKAWSLLALFVVSGALFLMPACSNISVSTITPNGVTPANTYSFTVQGVDVNGVVSSNTSTTGANPTVTLTVTKPTN